MVFAVSLGLGVRVPMATAVDFFVEKKWGFRRVDVPLVTHRTR